MVKRLRASSFRSMIAAGDEILLARRSPTVSPSEAEKSKSPCWTYVTALAWQQWSTSSSSGPPPAAWMSLSLPVVHCSEVLDYLPVVQCRRVLGNFSTRRDAPGSSFRVSRWRSSPSRRVWYEHCGFATAAVDSEERGKSWRGKGWNRVGCEEEGVEVQSDSSTASQFDAIPDLEEKLKFLETCGLGDNQLKQMRKRHPSAVKNTFLKLSVKKLIEVATFMEEEVGIERKDFGNILFANPFIAGSSVDDCLRPKVEFLRKRGITKEQMGKMVLRSPQILTYSLEGKLRAIEEKLLEIGLKGNEIGRIFIKHPAVFGTSILKFDRNVQSLRDGGITEVAKAMFKLPQIMSLSLDSKLEQIVRFLREELTLQQEQITKILSCQISILSFSIQDNIRPKVGFFAEMGLQHEDIARLVVKYPNVFCHSLDKSIKPKVQYLLKVMNLEVLELISFPHYLSYSLKARIMPRHEFVAKHGLHFRLSSLLSCCDAVFQKRYGAPVYSQLEESTS